MTKLPSFLHRKLQQADVDNNAALVVELMKRHRGEYSECWSLWLSYAVALQDLFRFKEAKAAFEQTAKLIDEEHLWVVHQHVGHLYCAQGRYDEAAMWYQKAVDSRPGETTAHIFLAGSYARRGDLQNAEEIYCRATTLEGDQDEAWLNLGGVLLSQERYEEARDCFHNALKIDPEYDAAKSALENVEAVLRLLQTS